MATKNSAVKTELRGPDLVALQPYPATAKEARVRRGSMGSKRSGRPGRVSAARLAACSAVRNRRSKLGGTGRFACQAAGARSRTAVAAQPLPRRTAGTGQGAVDRGLTSGRWPW